MRTLFRFLPFWARHARGWQLFIGGHSLFVAIALAPFLLGIHIFPGIGLSHAYSFFSFNTWEHALSGDVLMNRFNFNGFPSFIPVGFAFNPFTYIFTALLPPFTDLHWFMFATMVSGGVLCSVLLQRLQISRLGSLVGGMCYVAGSWWLVFTADYSPSMAMLPLAALVLLESQTHPVRAAIAGSLLCGYVLLGANTQVSLMIFAAFGVGAAVLSVLEHARGLRAMFRPLVVSVVSIGIGTVFGIPKIIPALLYGNLSWRMGGLSIVEATESGLRPLTIVTYLFPYAGFPFLNFGNNDLLQVYIGAFGLAFLLIGLRLAFVRNASPFLRWWTLAYILMLALAFNHSPLAALLHSFPPFSYFRGSGRWTMMSSFAAAPIVGMGFDALVSGGAEGIRRKLALFFGGLALALCAAFVVGQTMLLLFPDHLIALFQRYFAFFHDSLHLGLPLSYYDAFVERRIHELLSYPLFLKPRAFFPLLGLLLLALTLQDGLWKRIRAKAATLAALAMITTALTLLFYEKSFPRSAIAKGNAIAEYLQEHPGTALDLFASEAYTEFSSSRTFSQADDVQWILSHLMPNTNLLYNVPVLDYFDNIAARRPSVLAMWVGAQWVPGPDQYRLAALRGRTEEKIQEFMRRRDILDLQGVRYLISSIPLPSPFFKIFETRVTSAEFPLGIYENPTARPRVYFADSTITMVENEHEALERVLNEKWLGRRSLLECEPSCDPHNPSGQGEIVVMEDSATILTLTTKTTEAEWLVVTVNRLPGWDILLDGEPTDSVFANGAFFGIAVPAGSHTVSLRFSLAALLWGAVRNPASWLWL